MLGGLLSLALPLLCAGGVSAAPNRHSHSAKSSAPSNKPNIVLILTDDQDVGTLHRRFLPRTYEHLVDQGLSLTNFFTPVSLCCPSRVSLLRTQHAHNHNVTFVSAPWGGWDVFNNLGYVGHTLPDFVQRAGYHTYYTGKYMNAHTEKNCETLPVSGFTSSDILVDPYTYDYWNPGFSRDNGPVKVHRSEYSTDLVRDKALAYLDDGLEGNKPFFLTVAPIAPHSWIPYDGLSDHTDIRMHIPSPHPRHANMFPGEQLERSASFNPDEPHGVSWVKTLPKLNATQEAYLDEFYRGRLRALQAVDELVGDIFDKLEAANALENTYIFYTADNGYALGTHRRQPGKTLAFEEDMHVPFIVRGPNVPANKTDSVASYGIVDLSRTILDIAGAKTDYEDDGVRIDLHHKQGMHEDKYSVTKYEDARHSLTEYWVLGVEEGIYGGPMRGNNTYRTIRVSDTVDSQVHTYAYSVWCTGERELYDLEADPLQTVNLLADLNEQGRFADFSLFNERVGRGVRRTLLHRLDALLLLLKTCHGQTCRQPWAALTGGKARRLEEALDPKLDEFFAQLPRAKYAECVLGYQARVEKPEWRDEWALGADKGSQASIEWSEGLGGVGGSFVVQA